MNILFRIIALQTLLLAPLIYTSEAEFKAQQQAKAKMALAATAQDGEPVSKALTKAEGECTVVRVKKVSDILTDLPDPLRRIVLAYHDKTLMRTFDHSRLRAETGKTIAAMDSIINGGYYVISIVGPDEIIRTYDLNTGEFIKGSHNYGWYRGNDDRTRALALHSLPDERLLASVGTRQQKGGHYGLLYVWADYFDIAAGCNSAVTAVAIDQDREGKLVRMMGDADGEVWHLRRHSKEQWTRFQMDEHRGRVKRVAYAKDKDKKLWGASLGSDGVLNICDLNMRIKGRIDGYQCVESFAFEHTANGDLQLLVTGTVDDDTRDLAIFAGPQFTNEIYLLENLPHPITFIKNERQEVIGITRTSEGHIKYAWDRKVGLCNKDLISGCPVSCALDKIRFAKDEYGRQIIITAGRDKVEVWGRVDEGWFKYPESMGRRNSVVVAEPDPKILDSIKKLLIG
ncbi:MAG: hypothetical protein ACHQVS_04155 [Candidatus Babeliales bacterium]